MSKMKPRRVGKEAEVKVPAELRKALAADAVAKVKWGELTPIARRDFVSWIESAKLAETRAKRVERACSMLAAGKRRPCCYSIVPTDLYKAFLTAPKAKAQLSKLSSMERRDFLDWIEAAKEREARKKRIAQACELLAAGKRRA